MAHVKGAPGRLIDLAGSAWCDEGPRPLDEAGREALRTVNRDLAAEGLCVLAVGRKELAADEASAGALGEASLDGLILLGFVWISDPPAPRVAETIRKLHRAGLRTVMLTGDQKITARAIAEELGILVEGGTVIDGRELPEMDDAELDRRLEGAAAFSRVSPADVVLVDDRFETISAAVEEGRVIYDNIRKFIFYLFSCNLAEVLVLFTSAAKARRHSAG